MKEFKDASNRLSIELSDSSSEIQFRKYANRLTTKLDAIITNQLDSLDQRYWNFDVSGTRIVLHSDTFMGISIYVEDGTDDNSLRKIASALTND